MYRYGLVVRIEHNDFEQSTRGVSADHEHPILALSDEAKRDADRSPDVLVCYSMRSSAVRYQHQ